VSWSLKGKQIAVGLSTGDIITYSPTDPLSPKLFFPGPQVLGERLVVGLTWLSKTLFYVIMADRTGNDTENLHFIYSHDSSGAVNQIELDPAPCPPFGAERPSGPQVMILRDWSPFKNLVFVGDGPSSEMSLIANAEDKWFTVLLEESSIPNLPLDEDMNDTAILGFDIDLTSNTPIKNANEETAKLPAPILYVYASDGTVVARHIINDKGGSYHGLLAGLNNFPTGVTPSSTFIPDAVPHVPITTPALTQRSSNDAMQDDPPTPPTPKDRDMDDSPFGGLSLGGPSSNAGPSPNKINNIFGGGSFPSGGLALARLLGLVLPSLNLLLQLLERPSIPVTQTFSQLLSLQKILLSHLELVDLELRNQTQGSDLVDRRFLPVVITRVRRLVALDLELLHERQLLDRLHSFR
jgi:nucleoporin NUP159